MGEASFRMRLIYETPSDLATEAAILDKYVRDQKSRSRVYLKWFKLPAHRYCIDAALCNMQDVVRGWVEVKARVGDPDLYDEWYVSLFKIRSGLDLLATTDLPFILLFDWSGRTFKANLTSVFRCRVGWSGRTDRNDPQDVEPVVYLPRQWFTEIVPNGED